MTTNEKGPPDNGPSSNAETLGKETLNNPSITHRELCRVCGERLRLDEKDLCPDCRYWQPLLNWAGGGK